MEEVQAQKTKEPLRIRIEDPEVEVLGQFVEGNGSLPGNFKILLILAHVFSLAGLCLSLFA